MAALFEERRCLCANQHRTLVLLRKRSNYLSFCVSQTFALAFHMQFLKLLRRVGRKDDTRGSPQRCVIEQS